MSDTPRYDELSKHERHETLAETMYWCKQYSLFSRTLERENAAHVRYAQELTAALLEKQDRIAAQTKEIERLREDAARLDFMIGEGCYVAHASDGECCWLMWRPNEERSFVMHKLGGVDDGRAAIDAARRALGDEP